MSEQVWERAAKHTTPRRRHRPTAEREEGLFTGDGGARSREASPKHTEDGELKTTFTTGGRRSDSVTVT